MTQAFGGLETKCSRVCFFGFAIVWWLVGFFKESCAKGCMKTHVSTHASVSGDIPESKYYILIDIIYRSRSEKWLEYLCQTTVDGRNHAPVVLKNIDYWLLNGFHTCQLVQVSSINSQNRVKWNWLHVKRGDSWTSENNFTEMKMKL